MRPAAGLVVFPCGVSVYADDHICPAYAVERGVRYGAVRTNEDERQRLPEIILFLCVMWSEIKNILLKTSGREHPRPSGHLCTARLRL